MRRGATKQGFTTIELLVALSIASLLMVAVLDVARTAGATAAAMDRATESSQAWIDRFAEQLERDLRHAERLIIRDDRVVLEGHGALDPVTLTATHHTAQVIYRIEQESDQAFLVREQVEADRNTNSHRSITLIGVGVERLAVERLLDHSQAGPFADRALRSSPFAVPSSLRWTLLWPDEQQSPATGKVRLR